MVQFCLFFIITFPNSAHIILCREYGILQNIVTLLRAYSWVPYSVVKSDPSSQAEPAANQGLSDN